MCVHVIKLAVIYYSSSPSNVYSVCVVQYVQHSLVFNGKHKCCKVKTKPEYVLRVLL